jgi:SAM-dependent methyltransferase
VPTRIVQPELLDALPHDHPEARHNRRDLRLTNVFMGNHRWLARILRAYGRRTDHVLELGAGMGELAIRLRQQGWQVDGLDVCPAPESWPADAPWHRADLRNFTGYDACDAVYGNLIFHQFTATELRALGVRLAARTRLLLACEPARWRRSQWLFSTLSPLFGANHVSRHDAHVSIAAGFLGNELPRLLGLDAGSWAWRCATTWLGAYRMIAWRRAAKGIPA